MSGKDHKKSAVHYTARNLTKEQNPGTDSHMQRVGSPSAAKKFIVKQLLDLGFVRISSREFVNPNTGCVRVLPR